MNSDQLTFLSAAPPVKVSAWQDPGAGSKTRADALLSLSRMLRARFAHGGSCGRTCPECYPAGEAETLARSSTAWSTSGIAARGECWTLKASECPSDDDGCSLSDILEAGAVPPRFYLSAKAARGILRRAEARNKALPPALLTALEEAASDPSSRPQETAGGE